MCKDKWLPHKGNRNNRGVRQGDPLSALLYVITAEVLGNQIRSNQNISGVTIRNIQQKILQYADDTQIIVSDNSSIAEVFTQLRLYEEATGAKINIGKTEGLFMGKWKNRHDKPFDCKWTNDKVFALVLWIGNKDTAEIVYTEQLAKIKSKGSYWKPRKLSFIGRVRVVNIFILSRLWYRTEIFSIPPHILRELDSYIIEFVWNGKKHEVSKELLCASLENGGLGLTKITNKIFAQRIVWLSKLYNLDQNCFTKVIAEESIGNFDAEYKGLDFLKGDLNLLKVQSNDNFYNELLQVSKKFKFEYEVRNEEQQKVNPSFIIPEFLTVMVTHTNQLRNLLELGFFEQETSFSRKGIKLKYECFLENKKKIKGWVKTLQNDQPVKEECPLKIRLEGKLVPFTEIMVRSVHQELQKESVYNESYKQKWETTVKDTPICWNEIWSNIHKAKTSLEVKSTVYSQIHLGFYSEYLLVRSSAPDSSVCKLCNKLVHGQNHWVLHCKTLFDALDYFQPLISELEQAEVDQKELVFGVKEKSNRGMLRNLITFSIRFSIHKNRGTVFKNPNSAKARS